MKKLSLMFMFIAVQLTCFACPVCERNKKGTLAEVTHGSQPESRWDYLIVIVITIITLATLFYSIKWLVKPGEKDKDHIKYSFLNDN